MTVTLTDGRKFLAEVKGSDPLSDLAVLKIDNRDGGADSTPLPAATLGDSQDLEVQNGVGGRLWWGWWVGGWMGARLLVAGLWDPSVGRAVGPSDG